LAVLPACSFEVRGSVPRFGLFYPRAGLPALVAAGDTLVARVRLPAPLTPPPGVQQERALIGWRAELQGHAWPWLPGAPAEQRQPLAVVNVRPDGAASLIYRASIPIPAWLAPGTYDFALWAPGGSDVALGALRVLAQGHAARPAWMAANEPGGGASTAVLPIDVWVRAASAQPAQNAAGAVADPDRTGLAPAPTLELRGLVAALRIGRRQLWTAGACETGGPAFAEEVRGALERERRTPLSPTAPDLTHERFQPFDEAARAWPEPDALVLERTQERVQIATAAGLASAIELALLLPTSQRGVEVEGATLAFYPAGEIAGAHSPALVAIVNVPAGGSAQLRQSAGRAPWEPTLRVAPRTVSSGAPVRISASAAVAPVRVAWRIDGARTAFAAPAIETSFRPLGDQRVAALVIAADGRAAKREAVVHVRTARAMGCSAAAESPVPRGRPLCLPAQAFWLLSVICGARRARRRSGHATKFRAPVRQKSTHAGRAGIDCEPSLVEGRRDR
jgi:hypothetical protein